MFMIGCCHNLLVSLYGSWMQPRRIVPGLIPAQATWSCVPTSHPDREGATEWEDREGATEWEHGKEGRRRGGGYDSRTK